MLIHYNIFTTSISPVHSPGVLQAKLSELRRGDKLYDYIGMPYSLNE